MRDCSSGISAEYFEREWLALIPLFLLFDFFSLQHTSDACDGKYSPGSLIFFALGSYLYLNRGGEKGLTGELFKDHPILAL